MDVFQAVNTGCLALRRFGLRPCAQWRNDFGRALIGRDGYGKATYRLWV